MLDAWDFIQCPITFNQENAIAWFKVHHPYIKWAEYALAA